MKRKRHTPEQIVRKLREGDRMLNEGTGARPRCCGSSRSRSRSWNRWRAQYGGMKADEAKRLKELERENARLKKLVADQALDNDDAQGAGRGKLLTPERRRRAVCRLTGTLRGLRTAGMSRRGPAPLDAHANRVPPRPVEDASCAGRLREIARAHPRWGYKMAARIVRREGWTVNRKRIQRLWRDEGLKRPPQRPRKRRRLASTAPSGCVPDVRIMCGRSTSSSTRPPTSAG